MLSWDEKITNDEETEHLLEAIFAAVELNEAELETVTSAPSLYQSLQLRIGIGTPEESQTKPTPFQHTWPSSSTPVIERETPDEVFLVRQQFYGLNEKAVTTQPSWRLPHIRSNV
jgi:hypothetical protein